MEHPYKSHLILVTTWPSLDPPGFIIPAIRITGYSPIVYERLKLSQTFPTKAEAETHAIGSVKTWIDGQAKATCTGQTE